MRTPGFRDLPPYPRLGIAWPTPNQSLLTAPEKFFARTAANPDYGKPGWTRDCGKRFHHGCDITPVRLQSTGRLITVKFTDCAAGLEYDSAQPELIGSDPVFAAWNGIVEESVTNAEMSTFGRHVVVRHAWPDDGRPFFTLYAHLDQVLSKTGEQVYKGQQLGTTGITSASPDALNWMKIAPHLHFEVWDGSEKLPVEPVMFFLAHLA